MANLLIVDDEELQRTSLRRMIEQCQIPGTQEMREASDGRSALDAAAALCPDIMLLDMEMPVMDGFQVLSAMKECCPATRTIVVTAYDHFEYAQRALKLGASDFLLKPVRPETLRAALVKVSEQVAAERARRLEERQLREQLAQAMPYIKMAFVQDLIQGNVQGLQEIVDRAQFLGLSDLPAVALVLDIDSFLLLTARASEAEKQSLKAQVSDIAAASLQAIPSSLVMPMGGDEILVLLPLADERARQSPRQWAVATADCLRASVARATTLTVSIGVGRAYSDVRAVHKSYQEAVVAQRYALFAGKDQTVHIDDIETLDPAVHIYPFAQEQRLVSLVRLGNTPMAEVVLAEMVRAIFEGNAASLDIAKVCLFELLTVASRGAAEGGADGAQVFSITLRCLDQLPALATWDELAAMASQTINELISRVAERRQVRQGELLQKAIAHMEANFSEGLSLAGVAEAVHLSPGYFSRLFKQGQGVTFSECLISLRLAKARQLLRTSAMTIGEVGAAVGYADANYFSRAFSKAMGMSPTEYREAGRTQVFKV